jgi:hypothetical protein
MCVEAFGGKSHFVFLLLFPADDVTEGGIVPDYFASAIHSARTVSLLDRQRECDGGNSARETFRCIITGQFQQLRIETLYNSERHR